MRSNTKKVSAFNCFTPKQKKVIEGLTIPDKLIFNAAEEFDDKYVATAGDEWKFRCSGKDINLNFASFECGYQRHLCKYLISRYTIDRTPYRTENLLYGFKQIFSWMKVNAIKFNYKPFIKLLEDGDFSTFQSRDDIFFTFLFMLRELGSIDYPSIGEEIEDALATLPRPVQDSFRVYADSGDAVDPNRITQIVKGLWALSVDIKNGVEIKKSDLLNCSVLGVAYVAGPRPSQFDKLKVGDFKLDAQKKEHKTSRYSLKIPYAKKGRASNAVEKIDIALPDEVGTIIKAYIDENDLGDDDKLFPKYADSSTSLNQKIRRKLFDFCRGEIYISLTQFRHNAAHSLAMRGATAEDVAFILGHSSTVVARHYIMATPQLALVRLKALGMNATWQSIIQLMLTGELVYSEQWSGRKVAGVIGGRLHYHVGGCTRNCEKCPFAEVRGCYSCIYFRPFIDGEHLEVLYSIHKEIVQTVTLSESVGDMANPAITMLTKMRDEVMIVMKRIEKRFSKDFGDYDFEDIDGERS